MRILNIHRHSITETCFVSGQVVNKSKQNLRPPQHSYYEAVNYTTETAKNKPTGGTPNSAVYIDGIIAMAD